jgi:tetratricopeptide (TPR) repeat protein
MLSRSMNLYHAAGNSLGYGESQNCLGDLYRQLERYPEAEELLRKSLALLRDLGHPNAVAISLCNLGNVLCRQQDAARARACFMECLELSRSLNDGRTMSGGIAGLAGVAILQGQYGRAATLLGAADKWSMATGYHLEPADQRDRDWVVGQILQHLGEAEYHAAWRLGQQLSLAQAAALAQAED